MQPVRVGISACLLGHPVRYDGRDKRSAFLVERLGPHVQWISVCPEQEVGMGVPRESVRLVHLQQGGGARTGMVGTSTARDWTDAIEAFAAARVDQLVAGPEPLSGYVFKARSPSCGLGGVPRYGSAATDARVVGEGPGLFAAALRRRWPGLPVAEESELEADDAAGAGRRDDFLTALFAHHRLQRLWAAPWTLGDLVDFHTRHKMLLLAHHQVGYRALGRLVAAGNGLPREQLQARYQADFLAVLAHASDRGTHANVLDHLAGHLSRVLDAGARALLSGQIQEYRRGRLSRQVVVAQLRACADRYALTYVREQLYLAPYPHPLFPAV